VRPPRARDRCLRLSGQATVELWRGPSDSAGGRRLAALAQEPLAREVRRQVGSPCEGQARALRARPGLWREDAALESAACFPRLV